MLTRILAIDDEKHWLENFQAWIPNELASVHCADTSEKAISLLRRFCYNLVLVDLSMDALNPNDRSNRVIQEYLHRQQDGTCYMIVSGTADKVDVRDALRNENAVDAIFKHEIEPGILRDKIEHAFATAVPSKLFQRAVKRALSELVTSNRRLEDRLSQFLRPRGGMSTFQEILRVICNAFAPIATHKLRTQMTVHGNSVTGLFWSRQLGTAVPIVLCNHSITVEEAEKDLIDWLGYNEIGNKFFQRSYGKVHITCYEDSGLSPDQFDLPVIVS